jgi:uncharacterized protein
MSTYGDVKLTIFVNMSGVVPHNRVDAIDHVRTVMICTNDSDSLLLELSYQSDKTLSHLDWSIVDLEGLSVTEIARLRKEGEKLKEKRITKAVQLSGKIGRNQLCPCGSGKKFKRCCGNS